MSDRDAQATPAEALAVSTEAQELFRAGLLALEKEQPRDAIAAFEALADRGVVDAHVSFDRGLAYAQRVRLGGAQPGDLGRAAHGFEEARALAPNDALAREAADALAVVRAEAARKRASGSEVVELDRGATLGRSVVSLLPENAWAFSALTASMALACALVVRDRARDRHVRVGAATVALLALVLLASTASLLAAARHDRRELREAVVVAPSLRPADERLVTKPASGTIPEAARVELGPSRPGWVFVRWGNVSGWVPASGVRRIATAHDAFRE